MVGIKPFFLIAVLVLKLYAIDKKPLNYHLKGQEHPITKVKFNRLGYPIFESKFNCRLPFHLIQAKEELQFKYCTNKLREYLKKNPDYKKNFTQEQLKNINAKLPRISQFTWHHHQAKSQRLLQLVDRQLHDKTGHSGGRSIFGGGKLGRLGKITPLTTTTTIYKNNNIKNIEDFNKIIKQIDQKAVAVPALLTKDNKLIMSIKNGKYSGIAVVGIESGMAYYDYLKNNTYSSEFYQKVVESAIKGGGVASSEALVMFLIPSPQGIIILGAGVGGYILVDTAIEKYKFYKEKHFLNDDDLAVYGIQLDSILDINDDNVPLNFN